MLSREDKKAMKRARREAGRFDNLTEIGNATDLAQLTESSRALEDLMGAQDALAGALPAADQTVRQSLKGSLRAFTKGRR